MQQKTAQDKRRILWGAILIIIGFFLPWYDRSLRIFGLPNQRTSFNGPQLAALPTGTGLASLSIWGILITGIALLASLFVQDAEGCLAFFAQGGINLVQGVCVVIEIGKFIFGTYSFTTIYYPDTGIIFIAIGFGMASVGLYSQSFWQALKDNIQNAFGQIFGGS